ncbi:MAG: DUF805 domain-containing protein [Firmicutes bacterium]|nr:DUF805 domain-containing protein [Bacillota bacterium]
MQWYQWYVEVIRKYAVFEGRARRKEFWNFALLNAVIFIALNYIDVVIGWNANTGVGVLGWLYSLFVLVPSLAVLFRRLHDTGRSGWFILFNLIPVVGLIVLLVFVCLDSQPGENQYGPNPKEDDASATYSA